MDNGARRRVAVACQGGGSHTAFTAGVLEGMMLRLPEEVEIVALSGTSGGALCATLAWDGLLHDDRAAAVRKLRAFWDSMSATDPWDQIANQSLMSVMSLRDLMVLPEVSPYHLPPWGEEQFRAIIDEYFDFEELRELARRPGAPKLKIGAVEVLSGHFELFTGEELSAECLLASAAIPELFRAVNVPGRGVFWDGLFSQNPPIHNLMEHQIDELWLIQINSSTCARVPTDTHEILDRRNALSGNLSMEQELGFIESINRAIADKKLVDSKYRRIRVARISLDRELNYRSKLDRNPELLGELRDYGIMKWRRFLKERQAWIDDTRALQQELQMSV
ncbi:MAG TPA: patatin-like phospholipase family protein [Polyangia bacterium]|nr:patatin-like phospholipase family protein [Polyangia bacterium]